jgi:hypothetical protein
MMMLESQPRTLQQFKYEFFLKEFDGESDDALEPTWIPVGARRAEEEPSSF